MRVDRTWLRDHCKVTLRHAEEDSPYTDLIEDPEVRAWIQEQLARGNTWAWCEVDVRVTFRGYDSTQYLSACVYESEAAFKNCDCFKQLVDDGIEEIATALELLPLEHGLWVHDPVTCVWCVVA